MTDRPLLSTYRVQLGPHLTFTGAAQIADYLAELGVSHLYASPELHAAPGSTHGYDVVDHSRPSEALGGSEGHRVLTSALAAHGLGHVLDIVPNHMAVTGEENSWWWDVLEDGPASLYADYFDVDWVPPDASSDRRILLPVLGDHYGRVLGTGDLVVARQEERFVIRYYEHRFPVCKRSLDTILEEAAERTRSDELGFLAGAFGRLPAPLTPDVPAATRLHRDEQVLSRYLARLLASEPDLADAVDAVLAETTADRDALDQLLRRQHYRLAYWRTAGQELDYRRFFDISNLAGLRVEDPRVFAETHRQVLAWYREGRVDGFRVDHPDGLRDPADYFERLSEAAPGSWIVAEKILAPAEPLPSWPVAGTTGYEFLNLVGGLFIDGGGVDTLVGLFEELYGEATSFPDALADAKRLILNQSLAADLHRLTGCFAAIADASRDYQDFTRAELRAALSATLVAFPVYRTYVRINDEGTVEVSERDRQVITEAIVAAKAARPDLDAEVFDLLERVLVLDVAGVDAQELTARFQQLCGPVMAKGAEDTAFYRYVPLVAVNEVGGEPDRFGVGPEEFHEHNAQRHARWPATMTTTSTHDTKRSEDVRARLALLSEIPGQWADAVRRWHDHNAVHRQRGWIDGGAEYLLYQTLVGAHPLPLERARAYLSKALREAKVHTSWLGPNPVYEDAVDTFLDALYADDAFQADLAAFVAPLVWPGRVNSLAQVLLKLLSPGVADTYQGTELWDDSLVDPDNRRPVDYSSRRAHLELLRKGLPAEEILARADEGLPKMWVLHRALLVRRNHPELFTPGPASAYEPLGTAGDHAGHVVALARGGRVAGVVPRLTLGLPADWARSATVELPPGDWYDQLTGQRLTGGATSVADVLGLFPVALLTRRDP